MSLYAEYILEREGKHIVEVEHGYATYKFIPDGCYIGDIYVRPEVRRTGLASELGNTVVKIAKAAGCKYVYGTVCPSSNGSTVSVKSMLAYGFELHSSNPDLIVFRKEI